MAYICDICCSWCILKFLFFFFCFHVTKILGAMSINHQSDAKVSDPYLTEFNPMDLAIGFNVLISNQGCNYRHYDRNYLSDKMILGKNLYDADCDLRNKVNAPTELVIMDNTLWMSFIYSFESKQEWWNRTR